MRCQGSRNASPPLLRPQSDHAWTTPLRGAFRTSFFAYLDRHPEAAELYNAAMAGGVPRDSMAVYDSCVFGTIINEV